MEEIIDRKGAHQKMEIAHNLKSRKCHQNVLNVKSKFLFLVEKTEIILCNFSQCSFWPLVGIFILKEVLRNRYVLKWILKFILLPKTFVSQLSKCYLRGSSYIQRQFGISAFIPFHEYLTFCKYGRILTKINDRSHFYVKKFTDDNSNHANCKFMEINNACGCSYKCKELLWVVEYFYFHSLFLIIGFSTIQNSSLQNYHHAL